MKISLRVFCIVGLAMFAGGCTTTDHVFTGQQLAGDPEHPVKLTAGQFYQSSRGEWWFNDTVSGWWGQPSSSIPEAFALESTRVDFKVQEFSVRDGDAHVLPFVQLAPAFESHKPVSVVILAPGHAPETSRLARGVYRIEIRYFAGGASHSAHWEINHSAKWQLSGSGWIGMLLFLTVACAELPLLAYRFGFGVNRLYPWVAGPVRALAYTPTILAGGHGVMPFLTGPSLWVALNGRMEPGSIWLVWVPALVSAPICFMISEGLRRDLPKNGSLQAPRVSISWKRGMPLFRRGVGPEQEMGEPLDADRDWRVKRQREIHAAVFYFGVGIILAVLIGFLI